MQDNSEVMRRLVTGHKRDGRCQYDPQAKLELVLQCLKPGVSISRMAMQHGINANLLRSWITKHQRTTVSAPQPDRAVHLESVPAFIPVQIEAAATRLQSTESSRALKAPRIVARTPALRLHVRLPNGVNLEIDASRADELIPVVQMLGTLPCSN